MRVFLWYVVTENCLETGLTLFPVAPRQLAASSIHQHRAKDRPKHTRSGQASHPRIEVALLHHLVTVTESHRDIGIANQMNWLV